LFLFEIYTSLHLKNKKRDDDINLQIQETD